MRFLLVIALAVTMASCGNYFYDEIKAPALPLVYLGAFFKPSVPLPEGKTTNDSAVFTGSYDGTGNDEAVSIITTSDGGYLAAGNTRSSGAGGYDIILIKLDQFGNIEWQKTLGGSLDDKVRVIKKTSDSGYIIIGDTFSFGEGESDIWAVKLNSSYAIEWEKSFGGTEPETAAGIVEDTDGNFYIAGNTKSFGKGNYDFWMLKVSSLGALEWEKTFGNANNDQAEGIIGGNDGNYIIFGQSDNTAAGRYEAFLYEVDEWGDICSSVSLNGAESEYCRALYRTSDNGFAVVMDSNSFSSSRYSMWVVKLSSDLWTVEWQKIFNGDRYSYSRAAIGGAGESVIIGGNTNSYGAGYFDFWLIELSGAGAILNQKTYGLGGVDYLNDIQGNGRGGYILAGYSSSFGSGSNAMCVVSTGSDYSVTDSIIHVADSSAAGTATSGTKGSIEFQGESNSHHVEAVGTGAVVKDGEMVGIFY